MEEVGLRTNIQTSNPCLAFVVVEGERMYDGIFINKGKELIIEGLF